MTAEAPARVTGPIVTWAPAALAGLTLVAAPGARVIIGGGRPLWPLLVAGATTHLAAWAVRRHLAGGDRLGVVVLLSGFLAVAATGTLARAAASLQEPIGISIGAGQYHARLVVGVALVVACAFFADLALFRLRSPFLAIVPSISLLLLGGSRQAAGDHRLVAVVYVVVAMAFLLGHQAMASSEEGARVIGQTARFPAGLASSIGIAAVVVTSAVAVGPHLPGYGLPRLLTGGSSAPVPGDGGVTLSPLVEVNPMLTKLAGTELFAVASPAPSYWRLTSLDSFDGEVWSAGTLAEADSGLTPAVTASLPMVQEFELEGLRSTLLPAAFRADWADSGAQIGGGDAYIVGRGQTTRPGQRYRVGSMVPRPAGSDLRRLGVAPASSARNRYLALPADVPRRVVDEARRVTAQARADGPFAEAVALQTYFRRTFAYDLTVPPAHDDDALERFLFKTRRGYCEQFAASFAVMARAVGIPARVAVGFTSGDPGSDGRYHVRGSDAHAWPEVHLEGAGWLAFEPTPGRGMPGAEGYTGVPSPARAVVPVPSTSGTAPRAPSTSTTEAPSTTSTPPATTTSPSSVSVPERPSAPPGQQSRNVGVLALALLAAPLVALAIPTLKRRRYRTRRRSAAAPNAHVMVSWTEAVEALATAGLARLPTETLLEHGRRSAADDRLPPALVEPVLVLAGRAGEASYSGRESEPGAVAESARAAAVIETEIRRALPLRRRLRHAVDPRPLWVSLRANRDVSQGVVAEGAADRLKEC